VFVSRRGDRNKQIPAVVRWRRCARSPLDTRAPLRRDHARLRPRLIEGNVTSELRYGMRIVIVPILEVSFREQHRSPELLFVESKRIGAARPPSVRNSRRRIRSHVPFCLPVTMEFNLVCQGYRCLYRARRDRNKRIPAVVGAVNRQITVRFVGARMGCQKQSAYGRFLSLGRSDPGGDEGDEGR